MGNDMDAGWRAEKMDDYSGRGWIAEAEDGGNLM